MRLAVVSHKLCWRSSQSPTGYATDGGFPFQMRAIGELFDATSLIIPCADTPAPNGMLPLDGPGVSVVPLSDPRGRGFTRKVALLGWLVRNLPTLVREVRRADAVHAPIPGDVGTFGLLLALALRKPLFVRHCGNWQIQQTTAEWLWKWLMERTAGGKNIMLATGAASRTPSERNRHIKWIFSTSVTEAELAAHASTRQAWPLAPRLIICCRQDKRKGTGAVVEALPLIAQRYPGVRLDVVGDGPDLPHFKARASELGVADRIEFHGRVNHDAVMHLLKRADVFCFPTTASEGFPKAVVEAMACGLPVVATNVSALPSLLERGAGVLIDDTTPATIADAVHACVAGPDVYRAMSAASTAVASGLSLEKWQDTIRTTLSAGWGPLRAHA